MGGPEECEFEWAATKGRRGSRALFVMRLKDAVVASHSALLGAAGTAATAPPSCRSSLCAVLCCADLCCAVLCCALLFWSGLLCAKSRVPAVCGRPSCWSVTGRASVV